MDYPVWRKKPHTPAFLNFMRTYKLEPLSSNLEEAGEILKQVGWKFADHLCPNELQ